MSASSYLVSEKALSRFVGKQLSLRYPIGVDKEEGLLTLVGGAGTDVDILPADEESRSAAVILSADRLQFPLVHNAFRIVGENTDLLVYMGLEITVTGSAASSVLDALGVSREAVGAA